jgi:hypothetical protein
MKKMQYNYQKSIELLKYAESLRKQNKFLEDENKLKYLELTNYSLHQKNEYLQLMKDFVSFKVEGIEKECRLVEKIFEKLKTI